MRPASCDMLNACSVIALHSIVFHMFVCVTVCVCLMSFCALHVSSVTLLDYSAQLQLLLLRTRCQNVD